MSASMASTFRMLNRKKFLNGARMTGLKKIRNEIKLKYKEAKLMASTAKPQNLPLKNTSLLLGIKN